MQTNLIQIQAMTVGQQGNLRVVKSPMRVPPVWPRLRRKGVSTRNWTILSARRRCELSEHYRFHSSPGVGDSNFTLVNMTLWDGRAEISSWIRQPFV